MDIDNKNKRHSKKNVLESLNNNYISNLLNKNDINNNFENMKINNKCDESNNNYAINVNNYKNIFPEFNIQENNEVDALDYNKLICLEQLILCLGLNYNILNYIESKNIFSITSLYYYYSNLSNNKKLSNGGNYPNSNEISVKTVIKDDEFNKYNQYIIKNLLLLFTSLGVVHKIDSNLDNKTININDDNKDKLCPSFNCSLSDIEKKISIQLIRDFIFDLTDIKDLLNNVHNKANSNKKAPLFLSKLLVIQGSKHRNSSINGKYSIKNAATNFNNNEKNNIKTLNAKEITLSYLNDKNISYLCPENSIENSLLNNNSLASFINLKHLYLSNNLIQKIEGISELYSLTTLNISDNYIRKIEGLETLNNLEELFLQNNLITKLENLPSNATCLKEINISNQKLCKEYENYDKDLSFTFDFSDFNLINNKLSYLKKLNVSNNNIKDALLINLFNDNCNCLSNLIELDISNNNINDFNNLLLLIKSNNKLQILNYENNSFMDSNLKSINKNSFSDYVIKYCINIKNINKRELKDNELIFVRNKFKSRPGKKHNSNKSLLNYTKHALLSSNVSNDNDEDNHDYTDREKIKNSLSKNLKNFSINNLNCNNKVSSKLDNFDISISYKNNTKDVINCKNINLTNNNNSLKPRSSKNLSLINQSDYSTLFPPVIPNNYYDEKISSELKNKVSNLSSNVSSSQNSKKFSVKTSNFNSNLLAPDYRKDKNKKQLASSFNSNNTNINNSSNNLSGSININNSVGSIKDKNYSGIINKKPEINDNLSSINYKANSNNHVPFIVYENSSYHHINN